MGPSIFKRTRSFSLESRPFNVGGLDAYEDFKFSFLIRENKTWDFDPIMSDVFVDFKKGK